MKEKGGVVGRGEDRRIVRRRRSPRLKSGKRGSWVIKRWEGETERGACKERGRGEEDVWEEEEEMREEMGVEDKIGKEEVDKEEDF